MRATPPPSCWPGWGLEDPQGGPDGRAHPEAEAGTEPHRRTTCRAPAVAASGDKLKAELDDLLDEIDEVLETNAEDFVKSYVQKGGQ